MLIDDLIDLLDQALHDPERKLGPGVESQQPPLTIVRFYARAVRLGCLPILGRSQSIVVVATQPSDLSPTGEGLRAVMERVARVTSLRYPPWRGASLALTCVVVSTTPIEPDDDLRLAGSLVDLPRYRCVPLGLFRLNLDQEAMTMALRRGPNGLYGEPEIVAEALAARFRRFVPRVEI
jgi:hypothetical protein